VVRTNEKNGRESGQGWARDAAAAERCKTNTSMMGKRDYPNRFFTKQWQKP
jgi:hypothetical protein